MKAALRISTLNLRVLLNRTGLPLVSPSTLA